jgi:hypothetical protein
MSRTNERLDFFRRLVVGSGTAEARVRKLREYARACIPGVWHYPDDREPCPACAKLGLQIRHLPLAGIRGYLGAGPFSIVSDTPSGDVHFRSGQANLYYPFIKKYELESAFQTDVFNTANPNRDESEQQALFLVQLEIVQPKAMLVMDMSSRPRKRTEGWHYSGPLQTVQQHLQADGFAFEVNPGFNLRAATIRCEPPEGAEFSCDVFRVYHYTKLTDYRWSSNPAADWEKQFSSAMVAARLAVKVAELKAELEKLSEDRLEQLERDLKREKEE